MLNCPKGHQIVGGKSEEYALSDMLNIPMGATFSIDVTSYYI